MKKKYAILAGGVFLFMALPQILWAGILIHKCKHWEDLQSVNRNVEDPDLTGVSQSYGRMEIES